MKFSQKNVENWRFWKTQFFWVGHFGFFFKKFFFCFLPMKIGQSFLGIKDGSKFWWLPWSKITPSKHFSRQCRCWKRPKLHQNDQISQRSIWITLALWWEEWLAELLIWEEDTDLVLTSSRKEFGFFPNKFVNRSSLMHDDRRFFYCIRAVSCCTLSSGGPERVEIINDIYLLIRTFKWAQSKEQVPSFKRLIVVC